MFDGSGNGSRVVGRSVVGRNGRFAELGLKAKRVLTLLSPPPELPDDTPVTKVRFSKRIANALSVEGIETVGQIREASEATLLSFRNLGKGSVAYLRQTLGAKAKIKKWQKNAKALLHQVAASGFSWLAAHWERLP